MRGPVSLYSNEIHILGGIIPSHCHEGRLCVRVLGRSETTAGVPSARTCPAVGVLMQLFVKLREQIHYRSGWFPLGDLLDEARD